MPKLMGSLRVRLTLFFVIVTTLTLGVFGAFSRHQLSLDLEQRYANLTQGVTNRLHINLPGPLWNFDLAVMEKIVTAEMAPEEIRGIFLQDSRSYTLVGVEKNAQGKLVQTLEQKNVSGVSVRSPIFKSGEKDVDDSEKASPQPDGYLVVYFSRAPIEQALRTDFLNHLLQIFVVNLVLLLFLTLGLRLIFRPLERLRDAQFALARQRSEDMRELAPIHLTEIDALTQGFNETMSKLKEVIAHRTQAQTAALAATAETRMVLEKLVAAQEELVKAGKLAALGRLVGGIAHELNTPIGNGLMAASTLIDELKELKSEMTEKGPRRSSFEHFLNSVEKGMDITMRSLNRSATLVSNFKRIAMDKSTLHRRHFDVNAVVRNLANTMSTAAEAAKFRIETSAPEGLHLDTDPDLLSQLLTILLENAIVHGLDGRADGVVHISVQTADDENVSISVKDNGCGIAADHLPRIFDPFFTTRLGQGGSGLGLYIAHNITTEVLKGRLSVHSQVGVSTEFVVTIPRVIADIA